MRAVLDPNVIISALLSPEGSPARILREWQQGAFELVVSPPLLVELERAFAYPKLAQRIPAEDAEAVAEWLRRASTIVPDPPDPPPVRSPDPGDDYLIALAAAGSALLVSWDDDLLRLADRISVFTAARFLDLLNEPVEG